MPEAHDETGPEAPPSFERRVVLGRRQAAGLAVMMAVPVLALTQCLGDRFERHEVRGGGWLLSAEVPVCARDGDPSRITVNLSRTEGQTSAPMPIVDISEDYLERFTEVRRRPSAFATTGPTGAAAAPVTAVFIDLTPDRAGWARGRLGVTTETGERLELKLNTFVFP